MKIDIYSHIITEKYLSAVFKHVPSPVAGKKMLETQPTLWNLEERFRMMDRYPGYAQVILMTGMPVESLTAGREAVDLARLANDETAMLISKNPGRFLAGVAILPLGDIEASLKELERAVQQLKLKGIMIHTPLVVRDPKGKAAPTTKGLDAPELLPIYARMAELDLPIWIHPNPLWDGQIPDYPGEKEAKYLGWHIFGWPYQDTLAQVRLVFSGVLEKYPRLKFVNHHAGALLPFFEHRLTTLCNMLEMRGGSDIKRNLSRSPVEYFRQFYCDTAISGSTSALNCAYDFYGADKMLFGTDVPFDMELGNESIRETIRSVEEMDVSPAEKEAIFAGNAKKLLHLA